VILVVPMGKEALRRESEDVEEPAPAPRRFRYRSSYSAAELTAPKGARVAVIELGEVEKQIELVRGVPTIVELGLITMRIEPSSLIPGSKFMTSPHQLICVPSIGGASPRDWVYVIHAIFDGFRFTAEIREVSTALQNKNVAVPVDNLATEEEILISIPNGGLTLSSTLDLPSASTELRGRLILRNRR
jgi:hypothetical protein